MRISDLFYMRKSDRKAMLMLLSLAVIAGAVVFIAGGNNDRTVAVAADSVPEVRDGRNWRHRRGGAPHYYNMGERQVELFAFDPNTADSTMLLRLGLQPWQVRNIYKYRLRGGVFRKPSDFARVYGLTVGHYRALEPYIRISPEFQPAATLYENEVRENRDSNAMKYPVKIQLPECIVLNTADTSELKRVPGIGSAYARAIVNYRERLGGYYSVDQLYDIEELPKSCVSYFKISSPVLRKMNINKLTLNQLRRHPYINFYQAKAIVDYRRLHGPLTSIYELRLNKDFPPEAIERLVPYLEY